jgi:UDP-glucose 4-epimerase
MKILFTGATSFTGYWFVKELATAGHDIHCTFTRPTDDYTDVRGIRVERLKGSITPIIGSFGSDAFLEATKGENWDVFCHHAACVRNYKSADFDCAAAVQENCHQLPTVLASLKKQGCQKILLTGSVFEQREGAGSDLHRPFSPYGLSKSLTAETFRYYCEREEITLGKFVIPNPFGPLEDPRFTTAAAKTWLSEQVIEVKTPAYVRDNIHVSLLAKAYRRFLENLPDNPSFVKMNPSGYVECQGAFTQRLAVAMRQRLALPCQFTLSEQTEFPEPQVRINTEPLVPSELNWCESEAWDELADYYRSAFQPMALS